jgi:hypothetical protein
MCADCGKTADEGAVGWKAYRVDPDEVETYCPDCAEGEVGWTPDDHEDIN